ncbi:hypothetical protein QTJ16_002208 [Diplocarpon rosae]|uniref:Uncharacterized protein n=1 Tax=Diplocarpon rosae TaxID=946125 RepID=A0AAD9T6C7_9HELO|nr:hypothetical protein QTJ16_002208 [Diplocarpon rosae]PBP24957.1 hypothetical protein BUE80_DR004121 [Diplocarpon rosae]
MFKEVVSLAIILGFIWNLLYIDHPDTKSYTIAFVGSLAALSPLVLGWICWRESKKGVTFRETLSVRYWREIRSRAPAPDEPDGGARLGVVNASRESLAGDLEAAVDMGKGSGEDMEP